MNDIVAYNNKNIVLHELIGLRVKVIDCLDGKQIGAKGTVIDETKNTLLVDTSTGLIKLIKRACTFEFYSNGHAFKVKGKEINFRPGERTEKGMKYYKLRNV